MLPEDVRKVMVRCLLDTIGVAAVGSSTEIASITRQFVYHHMAASQDGPSARLLFDGRFVSPVGAAMAGASTIDSIDAHDGRCCMDQTLAETAPYT